MLPPTSSYLRTMRRTTFFQLTFLQLAQSRAKQYGTSVASQDEDATSTPSYSSSTSNMLDVCKHAAAQLDVLWPVAVAETTRSQYKGKRLPQVNSATKQPLPSSFDSKVMESLGLHRIPPMEPFVAAQLSVMSSRSSSLLSKSNRFQSVLTEKTHGAAALSARALNVLLLLTELCEDFARTQDPATWEEIPVITDLCVRVQRCAVQTVGKVLGTMVLQEQASLSDREKDNVLNMPIVQEGIFGSALASMQRCARSRKEDEELSPEKIPIFSSAGGVQVFTPAAA